MTGLLVEVLDFILKSSNFILFLVISTMLQAQSFKQRMDSTERDDIILLATLDKLRDIHLSEIWQFLYDINNNIDSLIVSNNVRSSCMDTITHCDINRGHCFESGVNESCKNELETPVTTLSCMVTFH